MEGTYSSARRRILRLLAGGIAGAVLPGEPAALQTPGQSSPKGAPRLAVASRTIKIGMSAAFTGTAAALGTELYRGAQAYYDEINDRGGIHGRPISVAMLDDRYEPLPCVMNTLRLLEEEGVFLLSRLRGNAHADAGPAVHQAVRAGARRRLGRGRCLYLARNLSGSLHTSNTCSTSGPPSLSLR